MSFGKNPHVAKAEAAELKARDARDEIAREQAWLEAARRWDRAAERETDDKRRQLYTGKAEHAREQATERPDEAEVAPVAHPKPKPSALN
jgi:hypothetical protein